MYNKELLQETLSEFRCRLVASRHNNCAINEIRGSKLIDLIHTYVKKEMITLFPDARIHPQLGKTTPEKKLLGEFKTKKQDVFIELDEDINKCICINVRSQLSSVSKNFDTIFERTFAESLNLRLKFAHLTCGEFMLFPTKGCNKTTDSSLEFMEKIDVTKIIRSYNKIVAKDTDDCTKPWLYHSIALVFVDFEPEVPVIIDNYDLFCHYFANTNISQEEFEATCIVTFFNQIKNSLNINM